jgi:hypothetical protein
MSSMARMAGLLFVLLGLGGLALAAWGLRHDVGWLSEPFYAYAWWSYILLLDGFCVLRRGHSLLTNRRRLLLPIACWSVTFWFFFEFLNLRFHNWYYVEVPPLRNSFELAGGGLFAFLCFATVFTGLFVTYEALTALGAFRSWRSRAGSLPAWVSYAVQTIGMVMASLAVLFPYYLAPLIWGSFTFLIDPWIYRRGGRSILRDLEVGEWGHLARLFFSGLLCGLVWESLNFFAPQKWIYTVRGLEELKLFEMPLLGFIGFPALAFDAFAGFSLASYLFHGNVTWEHVGDLRQVLVPRKRQPRAVLVATGLLQVMLWYSVSVTMGSNIGSLRVELGDLRLSSREVAALETQGIGRPRQLLRAAETPDERSKLAARLEWSEDRLDEVLHRAELMTFKGIGAEFATLLDTVGIRRVEDLRRWDPADLHARLEAEARRLWLGPPRLDMVRVWVLASRDRSILMLGSRA